MTNNYSLGAIGPMPTPSAADLVALPATVTAEGDAVKPQLIPMAPPPPPAWLSGPGGPAITREQAAWLRDKGDAGWFSDAALLQPEPALRFQTQAVPLAEPAWLASRGDGSSQLRGFLNNTDVYDIINENF